MSSDFDDRMERLVMKIYWYPIVAQVMEALRNEGRVTVAVKKRKQRASRRILGGPSPTVSRRIRNKPKAAH